jgi:L-threonylcarbamoyladenylate synthase
MVNSRVVSIASGAPDPAVIDDAAMRLRRGELVAFPTETVYGLGGHGLDPAAVAKIYLAKGRPARNPLILHIACMQDADDLVREFSPLAQRLAAAFWPGPLTLVLPCSQRVPECVTAGGSTVALRVPSHPIALALVRAAGVPIAAPSANRYQALSPTTAAHVLEGLGSRVDLILDGGATEFGLESTVVDVERAVVLRAGPIGFERLVRHFSQLQPRLAVPQQSPRDAAEPQRSPGLDGRHYAPRAKVRLIDNAACITVVPQYTRVAWLGQQAARDVFLDQVVPRFVAEVVLGMDPVRYGANLFAAMHDLDRGGCDEIWVEAVPTTDAWSAVHDRLARSACPADSDATQ